MWNLREASLKKKQGVERDEVEEELEALERQYRELKQWKQDRLEEDEEEDGIREASLTRRYIEELETEVERLRGGSDARCRKMLEQGLSCCDHADVKFVFEGGKSLVRGHRGMLCAASEEFDGMFRSGMMEERDRVVRVPPGVSVSAYRGFLEWVYLGEL